MSSTNNNVTVCHSSLDVLNLLGRVDGNTELNVSYRDVTFTLCQRGRDRYLSFDAIPGMLLCTETLTTQLRLLRDLEQVITVLENISTV